MIDVSDGLLADVAHIAKESAVMIDLHTAALDIPEPLHAIGAALNSDPVHLVLGGGDDHALVATFPDAASVPDGWAVIGSVSEAAEGDAGRVTVDGALYEGSPGWTHF